MNVTDNIRGIFNLIIAKLEGRLTANTRHQSNLRNKKTAESSGLSDSFALERRESFFVSDKTPVPLIPGANRAGVVDL